MLVVFSTGLGMIAGGALDRSDGATAATRLTTMPEFKILEETYDAIRAHYVLSNDVTDQQLMYGASRGMVEALGDEGHSTFLDPQEAQDFARELDSELIGIGVQIDLTGTLPVVIAPIDGSPAYKAGIRPGDVIISVDGVESARKDPRDIADLIRGKEGTDVTLVLRHRDSEQTYEVTITRSKITLKPVSYIMLPDNVLWLRIARFSTGTTEGVRNALEWGKKHGMTSVILDLRNNPGGYTSEAMGVGSQFLPAGTVLYKEQLADGSIQEQTTTESGGQWVNGNLVVLINEGSASAAEIVSSAIQDNDRGKLYGETTVGTGTVLSGYTLSDGSMALLGTKLWLTADGHDIWKKGIDPDVVVAAAADSLPSLPIEFDSDQLTDQQLEKIADVQLLAAYGALVPGVAPASTPAA
jgi:carboxyl-terminal processing protease